MVSPVLTYLSNSVLAGSRVKEIWATLLYYDYDSGHHSIPKINCGSSRGQIGDHLRVGDHFG